MCTGKIPGNNGVTLVKDISLHKAGGITGEKLYYKIQDFASDPVLFQFSHLPQVKYVSYKRKYLNNSQWKCNQQVLDYVESITGPNILSLYTMVSHFF